MSFILEGENIVLLSTQRGQLVFMETEWQVINSAYTVLVPKTFYLLNTQNTELKNNNLKLCYFTQLAFKKAWKRYKKLKLEVLTF